MNWVELHGQRRGATLVGDAACPILVLCGAMYAPRMGLQEWALGFLPLRASAFSASQRYLEISVS